jgi:hypothetical protein
MRTHAIVELEDSALSVTVGALVGGRPRVLRSLRAPLTGLTREAVTIALREIGGGVLHGATGVHVLIGDRRIQHFRSELPNMATGHAIDYVTREALRLLRLTKPSDVLRSVRLLQRLPGDRVALATTAMPRSVWEPLASAFRDANLTVLGLHSSEESIASIAPTSATPIAIVECSGGRARFMACADGVPLQVRRFMVGSGGEENQDSLTMQLAIEMPRTIDWLRDGGHAVPDRLLLGLRREVDADIVDMLRGDTFASVETAKVDVDVADGQIVPPLASQAVLRAIVLGKAPLSISDGPRLRMPWRRKHLAALSAAVAVGFLGTWTAVVDAGSLLERRELLGSVQERRDELLRSFAATTGGAATAVAVPQLDGALASRRPTSRLLAELSNCADDAIHIEELRFGSREAIVVAGQVERETRKEALDAMARFTRRIAELPYVQVGANDEISEVAGHWNRFRFRLQLEWRRS